jgi:hypothetical protein
MLSNIACGKSDDNTLIKGDNVKPIIECFANIEVTAEVGASSVKVVFATPKGIDDNPGSITNLSNGLASGSLFPIGTTTNTFVVTDKAGNTNTCSFDVIVTESIQGPYSKNNGVEVPTGKKWIKVENLSDDFDGTTFDDNKWHRNPANDGFRWYGRPPALFEVENVTVSDGNMNVTTLKYDTPKVAQGKTWTHGGAIIRSKEKATYGRYYECRMKANKTIMSSTFWIAMQQSCNSGPIRKLELDIQECVGRVHSGTHSWASKWDNIYHSNAIRHNRSCDIGEETRKSGVKNLTEKNHSRFFVYGCWWKSPTELLFYLDGEYVYSVTPTTDFDIDGFITMAIETYDWNPVDEVGSIFETASWDDRTTKYDWVRTWKLEDK